MDTSIIEGWLKQSGQKATDFYITEKGGIYNTKYIDPRKKAGDDRLKSSNEL